MLKRKYFKYKCREIQGQILSIGSYNVIREKWVEQRQLTVWSSLMKSQIVSMVHVINIDKRTIVKEQHSEKPFRSLWEGMLQVYLNKDIFKRLPGQDVYESIHSIKSKNVNLLWREKQFIGELFSFFFFSEFILNFHFWITKQPFKENAQKSHSGTSV